MSPTLSLPTFKSMKSRILAAFIFVLVMVIVVGGYAAWLTFARANALHEVELLQRRVYNPTAALVTQLQNERQLAVLRAQRPSSAEVGAKWSRQRAATDESIRAFRRAVTGVPEATRAEGSALSTRLVDAEEALAKVTTVRDEVVGGSEDADALPAPYSAVIAAALRVLDTVPGGPVADLAEQRRVLTALHHAREAVSEEVTVALSLAGETPSQSDLEGLQQLRGRSRHLLSQASGLLSDEELARWRREIQRPIGDVRSLEDQLPAAVPDLETQPTDPTAEEPVLDAQKWQRAGDKLRAALTSFGDRLADDLLSIAAARASAATRFAYIATIAGALFVILMAGAWLFVAPRHVVGQLRLLRRTAIGYTERLERVTAALRRGSSVDVAAATKPTPFGPDEFGQVGEAINQFGAKAVTSTVDAAEQANQRRYLVNLARRTQGMLAEQLKVIGAIERRADIDPDVLDQVYQADHAANRIRRYHENLILLGGGTLSRTYRKPQPMIDVIRGAVGEIRDYTRIVVHPVDPPAHVTGRGVTDTMHLLAELLENATRFSPPHTKVDVTGQLVGNGFAIEIVDRGIGVDDDATLAVYNNRLATPTDALGLTDTTQLGLFVVGQLAARHGISVSLYRSPYGGITAIVLVPITLLATSGELADTGGESVGDRPQVAHPIEVDPSIADAVDEALAGRHRQTGAVEAGPDGVATPPGAGFETEAGTAPGGAAFGAPPAGREEGFLPFDAPPRTVAGNDDGESAERDSLLVPPAAPVSPAAVGDDGTYDLPRRVRQANLAEQLRTTPLPETRQSRTETDPEEVRRLYSAFQRGMGLGRRAAAEGPKPTPKPSPRPPVTE